MCIRIGVYINVGRCVVEGRVELYNYSSICRPTRKYKRYLLQPLDVFERAKKMEPAANPSLGL